MSWETILMIRNMFHFYTLIINYPKVKKTLKIALKRIKCLGINTAKEVKTYIKKLMGN